MARIAAEVTAVGSAVVLAHLVPPAEFGRVAVALIIGDLALALANEGVGAALVRRRELDRAHVESAQLLSLLVGGVLTLITLLVVPLITTPLFGEETTKLFQLFAPMFLIAAIGIVPLAMLERKLDFRTISIIEIVTVQVTVASSILYAVLGLDAEAYVLGAVTGFAIWATLLAILGPNAWPKWHRKQIARDRGLRAAGRARRLGRRSATGTSISWFSARRCPPRPSASTTARTPSACSTRTRSARSSRGSSTRCTRVRRMSSTCANCARA